MAFSTVLGSGGAPDSFVGTTGVDAIALANSTGNFFLGANEGADTIIVTNSGATEYTDVLGTATIKGGAGADTLTIGNNTNATIYTGLFVNGGADKDTITVIGTDTLLASTVQGGKANDKITVGISTSSIINGNLGADTISADKVTTTSSVYGGGGNDIINAATLAFTSSLISGDLGNDTITLEGTDVSIDDLTIKGGDGVDTIDVSDAGATTDEGIFVNGNDGADTITGSDNAVTAISLYGGSGADTITSGAGVTTLVGGTGADTIACGAGINTVLFTAKGQGSTTTASATSTSVYVASGADSITAFQTAGADTITLDASEMLVGSTGTVASGGANSWNLNTQGLYALTADLGDATFNEVTLTVGTVTGDAGDIAYLAVYDATDTHVFQVTLGTTKDGASLNASDSITLIATVNGEQNTAADYAFIA